MVSHYYCDVNSDFTAANRTLGDLSLQLSEI